MEECKMKFSEWLKARKCGCAEIEKLTAELVEAKEHILKLEERFIRAAKQVDRITLQLIAAKEAMKEYKKQVEDTFAELEKSKKLFKVGVGETVYDITLKDKNGKFTLKRPCLETSTIKAVEVTEGNFFDIIRRIERKDVFHDAERARKYLEKLCEKASQK